MTLYGDVTGLQKPVGAVVSFQNIQMNFTWYVCFRESDCQRMAGKQSQLRRTEEENPRDCGQRRWAWPARYRFLSGVHRAPVVLGSTVIPGCAIDPRADFGDGRGGVVRIRTIELTGSKSCSSTGDSAGPRTTSENMLFGFLSLASGNGTVI